MEQAALEVVTNGLLKADTNISKSWEKIKLYKLDVQTLQEYLLLYLD